MRVDFGQREEPGRVLFPIRPTPKGRDRAAPLAAPMPHEHGVAPIVFSGALSRPECGRICAYAARLKLRRGRILNADPDARSSNVGWLEPGGETDWIYDKLAGLFVAVNRWYQYDLVGFVEKLQYATYRPGDRFGWHLDTGTGRRSTRKLSISVQLSEGDAYEGGELQFCGIEPLRFARDLGTVIVFPSFLAHRVTRITRGVRRVLVAWGHGPGFR